MGLRISCSHRELDASADQRRSSPRPHHQYVEGAISAERCGWSDRSQLEIGLRSNLRPWAMCVSRHYGETDLGLQSCADYSARWQGLTEQSRIQGGRSCTKTGNAHLRRILVEAPWHYRHRPAVGTHLRIRQRGASPPAIRCAWMAQHRLHGRYRRLAAANHRRLPPRRLRVNSQRLSGRRWRRDRIG
jgi:hypothetical protein